ncbi:MAG: DUF4440 domain-containing protein [Dongiaceae bacterium]
MAIEQELASLERQFWTKGAEFYRAHLDDECLVAFTEMVGVMSRDQIAATVGDGQRWKDVAFDVKGVLRLDDAAAILTYEASAKREDGDRYRALVSSLYVNRDGEWKMAFHQQTPMKTG